jgi:hypothetical protein
MNVVCMCLNVQVRIIAINIITARPVDSVLMRCVGKEPLESR